jgi:transglycosylase-like protein with SLT domain
MLVDPSYSAAGSTVTGAIRQASQATGTSFNYLLATAQVESGLNPQAGAPTSSARGLFQFVEQTWLGTMKQAGPALGYGRYADAITRTASGHYQVNDPVMSSEILKLRNDPAANAVMAGAFTKANAAILTNKLGRPPSEGELYIAHFLGAGGAARLIALAANSPGASAASYFGPAAHANTSIFYDRTTGAARSLAEVRNVLTGRYNIARSYQGPPSTLGQIASEPLPPLLATSASASASVPVPDTAGITNAFAAAAPGAVRKAGSAADAGAANTGAGNGVAANSVVAGTAKHAAEDHQIFHGLFQDADRAPPAASLVSELWTKVAATSGVAAAPAPQSVSAGLRDLFKDPAQGS